MAIERYDMICNLLDHIVDAVKTGVGSQWQQQGGQFESHNGRWMGSRSFELVKVVKGFNLSFHSLLTNKYFCRNRAATTMVGVCGYYHIDQIVNRQSCYSTRNTTTLN